MTDGTPTAAIMQPTYLPWIGYFDLIDSVDVFVLLDNVQLARQSWQTRNRIKGTDGRELLLSIPIQRSELKSTFIYEAKVNDATRWRRKHLASIDLSYRKCAHAERSIDLMRSCILQDSDLLVDITASIIRASVQMLGITTPVVSIRDVGTFESTRDDLLVDVCRALGATTYLSARGSNTYIEEKSSSGAFAGSGVALLYQHYEHPTYRQPGPDFISHLGIIDLLCNVGAADGLDLIRSGRRTPFVSDEIRTNPA
jgi:hypothetical protein